MHLLGYIVAAGIISGDKLPQTPATPEELDKIFFFVYITIGAIGLFLIVLAGYRYVMAQGDPQKIATAKSMLLYTLIGIVIAGSAAAIIQFILGSVSL